MDGKDVLVRAREFYSGPVIILSARDREAKKIEALNLGANDYVEKPFGVGELLARIRAGLRQGNVSVAPKGEVVAGEVVVDPENRLVTRNGEPIRLTPKEYDLLTDLARHAGKLVGRSELLTAV